MTMLIKGLLGNTSETKAVDCRELISTIVPDFDAVLISICRVWMGGTFWQNMTNYLGTYMIGQ